MRQSKYLNKTFEGWTCTHVGVARVQASRTKQKDPATNKFRKSKRPGHQTYYYIFERRTSDGNAIKMMRLNQAEAAKLYRAQLDLETVAKKRLIKVPDEFVSKISYQFIKPVID